MKDNSSKGYKQKSLSFMIDFEALLGIKLTNQLIADLKLLSDTYRFIEAKEKSKKLIINNT